MCLKHSESGGYRHSEYLNLWPCQCENVNFFHVCNSLYLLFGPHFCRSSANGWIPPEKHISTKVVCCWQTLDPDPYGHQRLQAASSVSGDSVPLCSRYISSFRNMAILLGSQSQISNKSYTLNSKDFEVGKTDFD
jgi:hypothetical protein